MRSPGATPLPASAAGPADALPRELRTERLLIRSWRGDDASELRPILLANQDHLKRWIPDYVYTAPPLPQLVERLDRFAAKFSAALEFRYALRDAATGRIVGGMSLFPRDAGARVQLALADRVELGYWLDAAATGRGFVTEGVGALLDAAARTFPWMRLAEIHCHVENAPSNAVPKRLGFEEAYVDGTVQVWRRGVNSPTRA
ncbi:MAG TPA: GNAT family N-acetyltransferase [Gemmatimonadaceae bacterium]